MKKIILNVLVVFCLMSSAHAKAKENSEEFIHPLFYALAGAAGGAALATYGVAVGVARTASLVPLKYKWGSLAIGVPAASFGVPYTQENKKLLEAAKNKNDAFLREKLIALNKPVFGTNYEQIKGILNKFTKLSISFLDAQKKYVDAQEKYVDSSERGAVLEVRLAKRSLKVTERSLKAAKSELEELQKQYPQLLNKWDSLRRLYGAIDAVYYGKGQYNRFFGFRKMANNELFAMKEKLDKQLGISDQ